MFSSSGRVPHSRSEHQRAPLDGWRKSVRTRIGATLVASPSYLLASSSLVKIVESDSVGDGSRVPQVFEHMEKTVTVNLFVSARGVFYHCGHKSLNDERENSKSSSTDFVKRPRVADE